MMRSLMMQLPTEVTSGHISVLNTHETAFGALDPSRDGHSNAVLLQVA